RAGRGDGAIAGRRSGNGHDRYGGGVLRRFSGPTRCGEGAGHGPASWISCLALSSRRRRLLMRARSGARAMAALWAGKLTAGLSRGLRRGGGTTLPGDVSRWVDPRILTTLSRPLEQGAGVFTGTIGKTTMAAVLNADDPMVAALGDGLPRVVYAGLDDPSLLQPELSHGADAKFCPRCGNAFVFEGVYFGHVGHYHCPRGDFARPSPDVRASSVAIEGMERMHLRIIDGAHEAGVDVPLSGLYNAYNVVLAVAAAQAMGVSIASSAAALRNFTPAFGRMEHTVVDGRPAVLLLAKNPTGFNEVLRTAIQFGKARSFLIALNDRIADGRDVSWIWDVDFEQLKDVAGHIVVSGDRALDLRVRLKYAQIPADRLEVVSDWRSALE